MYRKDTLSNGIRVVSETLPKSRSISIGVWVKVGSRHEPKEIGGTSHFIEHMFFTGTVWPDNSLGRPILGTKETIKALTHKDIIAYIENYYSPKEIVISAAGNFDHDPMVEMLNTSFGKLARTGIPKQEVTPAFTRAVAVKKKQLEQVQICLGRSEEH